ncbi:hypothetical protein TruAng_004268 [Truncatella angustata]|nr:hypothetical protein TruAng_004268 [Truncatella angustata]
MFALTLVAYLPTGSGVLVLYNLWLTTVATHNNTTHDVSLQAILFDPYPKYIAVSDDSTRELINKDKINLKDVSTETLEAFKPWVSTGKIPVGCLHMNIDDNNIDDDTAENLPASVLAAVASAPS